MTQQTHPERDWGEARAAPDSGLESDLAAERARLDLVLEASGLGTWELDLRTGISPVRSARHDRIFGYDAPLEDWSFERFLEHVHPDDRAQVDRTFRAAVEAGTAWKFECRIHTAAGAPRWIWARGLTHFDADGAPDRLIGVIADVSERKWVEERQAFLLRLSDALRTEPSADAVANRAIGMLRDQMRLDRCYVGVYRLEEDCAEFTHQVGNDRVPPLPDAVRLSDFPDALRIASDRTLVVDDVAEATGLSDTDRQNLDALGLRALVAATLRRGENKPLWAIVAISAEPRRWTPGEIALAEEVAERTWAAMERVRAETALKEGETRYRTLFESVSDGFCVFQVTLDEAGRGVDYRFLEVNPAFERHTGLVGAVGRRARELVPDLEPHWAERYGRVATTGQAEQFVMGSDAMERWFEVEAFRVGAAGEHKVALLFRDITERRRAEQMLREAKEVAEQASRSKSEFLAVMSHELRTPLNAIAGYADLIDLGIHGPVSDAQRMALGRIRKSQQHLLGLINEVLNYARLESGAVTYEITDVPLREILSTTEVLVEPQAQARGLALAVAECDPSVTVRADAEKLRQILLNLASNAVKFTHPGGRIEIGCEARDSWIELWVRDTGIGIPADRLDSIFEPFVQVRADLTRTAEGTGLGLAISRDLARGMGGELTVESTLGEGSVFTVRLPSSAPG